VGATAVTTATISAAVAATIPTAVAATISAAVATGAAIPAIPAVTTGATIPAIATGAAIASGATIAAVAAALLGQNDGLTLPSADRVPDGTHVDALLWFVGGWCFAARCGSGRDERGRCKQCCRQDDPEPGRMPGNNHFCRASGPVRPKPIRTHARCPRSLQTASSVYPVPVAC
jgi:hypothetical protein